MSQEGSSLTRWNCFGHLSEQAPHGGYTGGRVAFNGTRNAFDDAGCPVSLSGMGIETRAMGIDGESDDELVDDAGVSSEFYGTRMGTRGQLSPLSERETVSWSDIENEMLDAIDGSPATAVRRFMQSRCSRQLDQDDRTYIWSVLNEHGKCETMDDLAAIEGLSKTIERHLAQQRAKKAAEAEAKAETVKVVARPATAKPAPRPAPMAKPEAQPERKPESRKDDGERKGRRHGRRGGRGRNKDQAPQARPTAQPPRKLESPKGNGEQHGNGRPAPRRHNGLVFVCGEHRGQKRYECRHGSRLFVWDRKLSEQPVEGKSYDCVEVQVIAKGQLLVLAVRPV